MRSKNVADATKQQFQNEMVYNEMHFVGRLWMVVCISHDQCRFHWMYESDSWEYDYVSTKKKSIIEMHNIFHTFRIEEIQNISHMAIDCSVTHSAIQMLHI